MPDDCSTIDLAHEVAEKIPLKSYDEEIEFNARRKLPDAPERSMIILLALDSDVADNFYNYTRTEK